MSSIEGEFSMMEEEPALPLTGLRVIEITHMVMGPSAGAVLADLGADVIKIEPVGGDHTRRLLGAGAGYFPMFNRNKRSLCLDLKSPDGVETARRLIDGADVLVENFRPGTMARLGLSYAELSERNPRLIYLSCKGFLAGPYAHRTALDEVAQMMGGLAYMTGPPGRPLRAGSSVVDITGGMFGVIGILSALERRHRTGRGAEVKSALFETAAYLVGQHMAQKAVTGIAAQPMPVRISAWAIYDVFETAVPDEQLFVGVVSDNQWKSFCEIFGFDAFGADPALAQNNQRVLARDVLLAPIRTLFGAMRRDDIIARLEPAGLPFAPITRPDELFDDVHLTHSGGLVDLELADGTPTRLPALPVEIDGHRPPLRRNIPVADADRAEIMAELDKGGR